jgi:hypothetical protein
VAQRAAERRIRRLRRFDAAALEDMRAARREQAAGRRRPVARSGSAASSAAV